MPTTINIADKETLDGVSTKVSSIYNKLPSGNIANSTDISSIITSLSTLTTKVDNLQTSVNAIPTTGGGGGDKTKYSHVYSFSLSAGRYSTNYSETTYSAYIKAPSDGMIVVIMETGYDSDYNVTRTIAGQTMDIGSYGLASEYYLPSGTKAEVKGKTGTSSYKAILSGLVYANSAPYTYKSDNTYASVTVTTIY